MSIRDEYILNQSMMNQSPESSFNRKMFHTVQDNNSSGYGNNQINYQLSNIYNLNKYYDWSNSLLLLPIKVTATYSGSADFSANILENNADTDDNQPFIALKNNLHLINQMQMSVNQKVVHQSTSNINEYYNFVKLTETSPNTLQYLEYLNFYPEDFNNLDKKYNLNFSGATDDVKVLSSITNNIGNFESFKYKADKMKPIDILYNSKYLKTGSLSSQLIDNIEVATTKQHIYHFMAYIKLSDFSDFFKKVGISKLFVDTLNLFLNMGTSIFTCHTAGRSLKSGFSETSNSFQFNTCPFYVNNNINILTSNAAVNDTITFKIEVRNNMKQNTEIYIPGFELDPTVENSFISNPVRDFYFRDFYFTNSSNITSNSNFSLKLNNSIANAIGLLIIPYVNTTSNGTKSVTSSPINIEPNTPSLGINLTNLNALIAGTQILLKSADYNYEHFMGNLEYGCVNTINGGYNLENSLLNLRRWNTNHRYYYFNLQFLPEMENISQNVELKGLNNNNFDIYLNVFIIYNKKVSINKENGNIIEMV